MEKKESKDPKCNAQKVYGITDAKGQKLLDRIISAMRKTDYKSDAIDTLFPKLTKEQRYTIFLYAEIQMQKAMCNAKAKVATDILEKMLGGIGGIGSIGVIQATSKEELLKQLKDLEAGKPQHE